MIMAVFSDIHGNIFSLEKALKVMEKYKPDQYLFLGDMAGYYYYQNESINLLNTLDNLISIKGNHDHYFLNSINNKDYILELDKKYGKSYSLLHKLVSNKGIEFFNELQEYEKNNFFEAYHGSPNSHLEGYLYPDTTIEYETDIPIVFTGHTHYPMEKKVNNTLFINPGSIGQPRDFNKGSFSIVDLKDKKVENVRYDYNYSKLLKKIKELDDNKYLVEVLNRLENEKN